MHFGCMLRYCDLPASELIPLPLSKTGKSSPLQVNEDICLDVEVKRTIHTHHEGFMVLSDKWSSKRRTKVEQSTPRRTVKAL